MKLHATIILTICIVSIFSKLHATDFPLVTKSSKVTIVYDPKGTRLDSITAYLLAQDISLVTNYKPTIITDLSQAKGYVILLGNLQSAYIQKIVGQQSDMYKMLEGKWECFGLKVIDKPTPKIAKALVIAGSDNRGTAYGVFTLSEKIGVSPWYWWADVPVNQKEELSIQQSDYISAPPHIKYRGIFINDEDWGLQPWAAKTFEPETGDIGPKTYAQIFELLLRLKANLIWPAMHPSTKAFYHYPKNKRVAADYSIVIGSSHAEPMLRNNVSEWNVKSMGDFNYVTNKQNVYQYWEERVKETQANDVIYTVGMRGVHDSGIEGVKNVTEAVPLLEQIITDQRNLIEKYNPKKITSVPQVFTTYKEVLDIYDNGLKLPDDVTLVWPDDNYGYIRRLNSEKETNRSGSSGIYYHASYWGRPHDYLWLSTTHPSLIREEMIKAYEMGSDRVWVLNVGDIKPAEYTLQLFMDMAFTTTPFRESSYSRKHLQNWSTTIFGTSNGIAIGNILWRYYQLAFERRPEFMGWSQTEPTTPTHYTDYNHFYYGDEAQRRIDAYDSLQQQIKKLRTVVNDGRTNAFYELVYYPVASASLMNKKFLYHDKAYHYTKQNRSSALDYVVKSRQAYDSIVKETEYYNTVLVNGKWKYMMSMHPRDLPVYKEPGSPNITIQSNQGWSIMPEGYDTADISIHQKVKLPIFNSLIPKHFFVDVFLCDTLPVQCSIVPSHDWIILSQKNGRVFLNKEMKQARIWVSIDWTRAPKAETLKGEIIFRGNTKQYVAEVSAINPDLKNFSGFLEDNDYLSFYAQHFAKKTNGLTPEWRVVEGLGHTGNSLIASITPSEKSINLPDTTKVKQHAAYVEYDFYLLNNGAPKIYIYSLPILPVNNNFSSRVGSCVDDGPAQIVDFKTVGRSETWKQNVLRNYAVKKIEVPELTKGKHTLKIYSIDPGVILDRIVIDLGGMKNAYSPIPETVCCTR